jgi:hypothetical protein
VLTVTIRVVPGVRGIGGKAVVFDEAHRARRRESRHKAPLVNHRLNILILRNLTSSIKVVGKPN